MARPDRSPFTSATKQGTPAADRPSMMPWMVTVLPVPVAPRDQAVAVGAFQLELLALRRSHCCR